MCCPHFKFSCEFQVFHPHLSQELFTEVHLQSVVPCGLWNKASRSSQAADQVEEVLKQKLIVPTVTRWNSYFDAVQRIIENSLTDLNELCTIARLDLRCFSERELSFLKEYHKVLKPLASGLDIHQGEDNCFYGGAYIVGKIW